MTRTDQIELALRRADLVRKGPQAYAVTAYCKIIARQSAKLRRLHVQACNGIQRYNFAFSRFEAEWTEADQAHYEAETAKIEAHIRDLLTSIVKRGFKVKFYSDPRAGCAFRVSNAANTRDCFV